ncbi:MAG TPA: FAD-dependent oxidoreductase [Gemmatimonadales bacterium]|jgi:glycine oxidase
MPVLPDVLIVGGGVVGASCARAIARAGGKVTVLQRAESAGDAWRASAGMLAAQVEGGDDTSLLELGIAGRAFYSRTIADLQTATGMEIALQQLGILELAAGPAAAERFKERVARQRQRGYRANWLDPDEVIDRWPWLGRSVGGFWSPDDGVLVPEQLVAAFRADAANRGATIVTDTIRELTIEGGRVIGVASDTAMYRGGAVLLAAGAWSGRLGQLPRPLSVEPVRGQMLAFPWPAGAEPAVVYGDRCYVLPRQHEMLVGATVEHVGFELAPDPVQLAELHQRAAALVPALAGQPPLRHWSGLRPGTPDGLPIIGAEPLLPGLWYATGHGRHGVLLAGITGELVARELAGVPADDLLQAFRPTRFWN